MAKRVMFDVASCRVSVVGTAWRGEFVNMDRCLTTAKLAAQTGGQNRNGRARWLLAGVSHHNSANQSGCLAW